MTDRASIRISSDAGVLKESWLCSEAHERISPAKKITAVRAAGAMKPIAISTRLSNTSIAPRPTCAGIANSASDLYRQGLRRPILRGFFLRDRVVQESPCPAFNPGQKFQFGRTPLDRVELHMEMEIRMLAADGLLPHRHHERNGKSPEIVVFEPDPFNHARQFCLSLVVKVRERGEMAPRINLYLARPLRMKRNERDEVRRFQNNARTGCKFTVQDPAIKTLARLRIMLERRRQFALHQRRDEWKRIDLPVRMRHGHSDRLARIFKYVDIS